MSPLEPITSLDEPVEAPEEDPYRPRLRLFRALIILALAAVAAQLWRLQVVEGSAYRLRADNNRFRLMAVDAPRGVIYDRYRTILARNRPSYTIAIVQVDLPPEPEPVYRRLGAALGLSPAAIRRQVEQRKGDRFNLVPIRTNVSQGLAFVVEERHRELPGVHVVVQPIREYVDGPPLAHVLGYTGALEAEQYAQLKADPTRRYRLDDRIGQAGIEGSFEAELRGTPGERQMEVDAAGREVRLLAVEQPTPGRNLTLTIDVELQQLLYELLAARLDEFEVASAVALEPATGQVLALVHLPTYDNNAFSRGITEAELQALLADERKPLVNGAIGAAYPPGAVVKPLTAAAALHEGVVQTDELVSCPGQLIVPSRLDPTLGTRFTDPGGRGHGEQDVVSALANSCDVYFYLAGGGQPDGKTAGLGIDRLVSYAQLFGLGGLSGIDLGGEVRGTLRTPQSMKRDLDQNWYKGDTYLAAVGADHVLATPLQIANAVAAIANGGTLYRPQLVLEVSDSQGQVLRGFEPQPLRRLGVSPAHLATVREGLLAATGEGKTSRGAAYLGALRQLAAPGLSLGGVAATVEYARPGPRAEPLTHGWFVGFTPAEAPRVVLAIFLRRGRGAEDAAALGREVLARYQPR